MKEETEKMLIDAIINLGVNMENLRKEMKEQLAKVNLTLGEMRLSYMQLDESFNAMRSDFNKYAQRNDNRVDNHETRIIRLETKTSGSANMASEPKAEYKKRKKKK